MSGEQIKNELTRIDSLLRSKEFSLEMAATSNAAYDGGEKKVKPLTTPDEDTSMVHKSVKEEKIAMNLAGFYALECGLGLLCEQTKQTPVEWLQKIAHKTADSNAVLLLNRFANATWKAGQPFRSLDRITRYNFTGAGFLSAEEVKKDYDQVIFAASKLLESMKPVQNSTLPEQMKKLRNLLQDTSYAVEMAEFLEASYYKNQHQPVPLFLTKADDSLTIHKTVKEQKIATSIAGFYALECGINYLVTRSGLVPTDILKSIVNNSISETNMLIFLRLANATWKAGQPFRDLNRIQRDTFTPAYFLSNEDIEKDRVQIWVAARKLLETLEEQEIDKKNS